MLKQNRHDTARRHIIIFGLIFISFLIFITYRLADGVTLDPGNITIHTSIVYYDHRFSSDYTVLDTKSALFFVNQSNEKIFATIFEYDKAFKETSTKVIVYPGQSQYIKTDGAGTVYLQNQDKTATSFARFSKWTSSKKYNLPNDFSF